MVRVSVSNQGVFLNAEDPYKGCVAQRFWLKQVWSMAKWRNGSSRDLFIYTYQQWTIKKKYLPTFKTKVGKNTSLLVKDRWYHSAFVRSSLVFWVLLLSVKSLGCKIRTADLCQLKWINLEMKSLRCKGKISQIISHPGPFSPALLGMGFGSDNGHPSNQIKTISSLFQTVLSHELRYKPEMLNRNI